MTPRLCGMSTAVCKDNTRKRGVCLKKKKRKQIVKFVELLSFVLRSGQELCELNWVLLFFISEQNFMKKVQAAQTTVTIFLT